MAIGVMFHHFVDDRHPYIQGALSADELDTIIRRIGPDRILAPDAWIEASRKKSLKSGDVCLTFDDALLSQLDVAVPVLDSHDLKGFFFVYSSVFQGKTELFEVIRFFRNTCFDTNAAFYQAFYDELAGGPFWAEVEPALTGPEAREHLRAYDFYTTEDRVFRYVRDRILDRDTYYATCEGMIASRGFNIGQLAAAVWLNDDSLRRLDAAGHTIGLHSTSHPTNLGHWSYEDQRHEYEENRQHLVSVLGHVPRSVAYPSGSYDASTLRIMHEFGVEVGFRSDSEGSERNVLEQPRIDHSLYIRTLVA